MILGRFPEPWNTDPAWTDLAGLAQSMSQVGGPAPAERAFADVLREAASTYQALEHPAGEDPRACRAQLVLGLAAALTRPGDRTMGCPVAEPDRTALPAPMVAAPAACSPAARRPGPDGGAINRAGQRRQLERRPRVTRLACCNGMRRPRAFRPLTCPARPTADSDMVHRSQRRHGGGRRRGQRTARRPAGRPGATG